jgi:hypothetical protein
MGYSVMSGLHDGTLLIVVPAIFTGTLELVIWTRSDGRIANKPLKWRFPP